MLNKKGLDTVIVAVIGAIIFLAILLIAFNLLAKRTDVYAGRETCLQSVNTMALAKKFAAGIETSPDLNCRTHEVNFDSVSEEDAIKKEIADQLFWCKWQFSGGSSDGKGQVDFISDFKVSQNRCYVCSRITFSDEIKKKYPYGIKGALGYMNTHEIPIGGGLTYPEYLSGEEGAKFDVTQDNYYSLNEPYWIVFHAFKGNVFWNTQISKRTAIIGLGGAGVAAVIGIVSNPVGWVIGGVAVAAAVVSGFKEDRYYYTTDFYTMTNLTDTGTCGKVYAFPGFEEPK